jgi:hypothetical protein
MEHALPEQQGCPSPPHATQAPEVQRASLTHRSMAQQGCPGVPQRVQTAT